MRIATFPTVPIEAGTIVLLLLLAVVISAVIAAAIAEDPDG